MKIRCNCGCNNLLEEFDLRHRKRKYIHGHNLKMMSEESKLKQSQKFRGRHHTEETKRKIGNKNRGKIFTIEHRKKLSKSHKGKKHSIEHIEKMRKIMKGRKVTWGNKISKSKIGKPRPDMIGNKNIAKRPKVRKILSNKMSNALKRPEVRKKLRMYRLKQIFPRKNTSIEEILYKELIEKGYIENVDFFRHFRFHNADFSFIHQADFVFPSIKLVIECDGNYWHNYPIGTFRDIQVDEFLENIGWKVLRFWGRDIKSKTKEIGEKIKKEIENH